ncbi:MAG: DUF438 domain-containing protein [Candidatus Diapherotrites archaeon]|nr:DUF438 domain-containing protein [Candidatus Diapherotrites archaeon]
MIENIPPEIIESIFDSLPIEISFIDAEDTVRYYNREGNRIFPRTPAVIGMKVQNCHPKKSLDKVEEILNGFRAGTLDKAEFWIDLHGKKVLIRYFPVRDENGKYLGCIEATQDITQIQKLTGEKRLL